MRKLYKNTSSSFLQSSEFNTLLETKCCKVQTDTDNVFVHLQDFCTELKAYRVDCKKRKHEGFIDSTEANSAGVASPCDISDNGHDSDHVASKTPKITDDNQLDLCAVVPEHCGDKQVTSIVDNKVQDRTIPHPLTMKSVDAMKSSIPESTCLKDSSASSSVQFQESTLETKEGKQDHSKREGTRKVTDRLVQKCEKLLKVYKFYIHANTCTCRHSSPDI